VVDKAFDIQIFDPLYINNHLTDFDKVFTKILRQSPSTMLTI